MYQIYPADEKTLNQFLMNESVSISPSDISQKEEFKWTGLSPTKIKLSKFARSKKNCHDGLCVRKYDRAHILPILMG